MFADGDAPAAADSILRDALDDAVTELGQLAVPFVSLREEALRAALYESLGCRLPGRVRKERHVDLVPMIRAISAALPVTSNATRSVGARLAANNPNAAGVVSI